MICLLQGNREFIVTELTDEILEEEKKAAEQAEKGESLGVKEVRFSVFLRLYEVMAPSYLPFRVRFFKSLSLSTAHTSLIGSTSGKPAY